jgi:exodeoxyribonuclease VII small subunit
MSAGATPDDGETFEAMVGRLEEIVRTLEKGELPLEKALDAYAEGVKLAKGAQGKLDGMDRRLEQLLADGRTAPMSPGSGGDRDG